MAAAREEAGPRGPALKASTFVAPIPTLVVGRFSQLLARGYLLGLADEEGLLG